MQISWLKKLCLILGGLSYGRDACQKMEEMLARKLETPLYGDHSLQS